MLGWVINARAMATRWACPPDSSPGRRFSIPARPSRASQSRAAAMAVRAGWPSSISGRATFSLAGSSASNWPDWNRKPKSRRRSAVRCRSDIDDNA